MNIFDVAAIFQRIFSNSLQQLVSESREIGITFGRNYSNISHKQIIVEKHKKLLIMLIRKESMSLFQPQLMNFSMEKIDFIISIYLLFTGLLHKQIDQQNINIFKLILPVYKK